jgi:hypothetical protein
MCRGCANEQEFADPVISTTSIRRAERETPFSSTTKTTPKNPTYRKRRTKDPDTKGMDTKGMDTKGMDTKGMDTKGMDTKGMDTH